MEKENFRNKQWFKKLSDERKAEICKKFKITEQTLKKCGRENKDGKLVIDLLRIDHLEYVPESWKEYYNILSKNTFDLNDEDINICIKLYKAYNDVPLLKYKDTLHNKVILEERIRFIKEWLNKFYKSTDVSEKEYFAYQVMTQVKILIESDLNLLKH